MQAKRNRMGMMAAAAGWVGVAAAAAAAAGPDPAALAAGMDRGAGYLLSVQGTDGAWLGHPAVTALACMAVQKAPLGATPRGREAVARGLALVVRFAQPDGSIWAKSEGEYPNYSTAICLLALHQANRPQDRPLMQAARAYLIGSQFSDVPGGDPAYGGIGYGKSKRPDLSNTQWALEALYATESLDRDTPAADPAKAKAARLCWERAIRFLSRCQNLPESNDQAWVSADPADRGGFVYRPGESKAGKTGRDGRPAAAGLATDEGDTLRSYGSMTYAGLKSMLYARLPADDPRVRAACGWLEHHYTFDENPGMGAAGLYYYLHTAAKALAATGRPALVVDGKPRDWRADLAASLLARQRPDGGWRNDNGRWMESVPELTTAYAVLTLAAVRDAAPGP
ncbi:MAG: prenyltransferase/squalene oxidase repeat-containing protein [Lentisphaeria bacterium]